MSIERSVKDSADESFGKNSADALRQEKIRRMNPSYKILTVEFKDGTVGYWFYAK